MLKSTYKMKLIHIIILCLFAFLLSTCNFKTNESKSIVEDWYQKEIIIPNNLKFKSFGRDTVCSHMLKRKFKVLVYIDSLGCTACKLNLSGWKEYIDTCKLMYYDVGFLFAVQSKNYRVFELRLKESNFNYPIIYDYGDEFNKTNNFPKEEQLRTFLLDKNNKVILIGSPINNLKIRELYNKVLMGKNKKIVQSTESDIKNSVINTSVNLRIDSIYLGKFNIHSVKQAIFQLKNLSKQPLIIQAVNTSCGCTVAKYDKKPIGQGHTATVILEYKPDKEGYFSKTADVVCNVPDGYVRLKISGEVVKMINK